MTELNITDTLQEKIKGLGKVKQYFTFSGTVTGLKKKWLDEEETRLNTTVTFKLDDGSIVFIMDKKNSDYMIGDKLILSGMINVYKGNLNYICNFKNENLDNRIINEIKVDAFKGGEILSNEMSLLIPDTYRGQLNSIVVTMDNEKMMAWLEEKPVGFKFLASLTTNTKVETMLDWEGNPFETGERTTTIELKNLAQSNQDDALTTKEIESLFEEPDLF